MRILKIANRSLLGGRIKEFGVCLVQTATITSRQTRGEPLTLPKPFPYQERKFRYVYDLIDPTVVKMSHENCKLIVVEGPIGVGKTAFCKAIAEQFDMHYIPQATMDFFYKLPSGYDLRQHDHEVPDRVKTYDHRNFCIDPVTPKAGRFQVNMLFARFFQYMDAMCHMLNTGQGVILERSYYSDYVFAKAMTEQKYISKAVAKAYHDINLNTSTFFSPPHLIIYLDIPVPEVQDRIRTRNYSYEQNSPALTKEYLTSLDKFWKKDYLKRASEFSEILIYDWSDGGDVDVVIDDIEKLDLDIMRADKKFALWRISRNDLFAMRYQFTNKPYSYENYFKYPWYKVEEAFIPQDEAMYWDKIQQKIPECQYDVGYNYLTGDSIFKILFKKKIERPRAYKKYLNFATHPD